ncbi:chemotaxis protein CheA [Sessilibacter corallicola]|uniref:histidine kinase n=1 Tax=Sessilibacter corallicola TaxID=2904075 RepID=A0ABQ0AA86_9GAMM
MGFGDDEEILQDFLVEAGEILELLSEQLVELEQSPDDRDLLNAIFRGFHTVKGGAGFLQIGPMVDCCHVTENLFDILRTGKREVTSELMDVVLEAVDTINEQFEALQARQEPDQADPGLIHRLGRLVACEDLQEPAAAAPAPEPEPVVEAPQEPQPVAAPEASAEPESGDGELDISDGAFANMLDAIADDDEGAPSPETPVQSSPAQSNPEQTSPEQKTASAAKPASAPSESDEITDDEFEALLDQLHGEGNGPTVGADSASAAPAPAAEKASPVTDPETITEDEFENLLDEIHGQGQGPTKAAEPKAEAKPEPNKPEPSAPEPSAKPASGDGEEITEDEFEQLLDEIHGQGQGPSVAAGASETPKAAEPASTSEKAAPAEEKPKESPEPVTAVPGTGTAQASANTAKPDLVAIPGGAASAPPAAPPAAPKSARAAPKAPAKAGAKAGGKEPAAGGDTTVRVDTQRLDDIMNMVGELVLVRNRLVRLGDERGEESLSKAVSNLDVVTADLQTAVMKTRMQPIKKVFGRFPRVVRDLARSLNKEINLELVGEDTDLDKNLVEALADPLVHLVRNSVDHGVETPEVREKKGKPRVGKVVLSAQQEGDHILLSITDDGGGMDPNKLRQIAVDKGVLDEDAAARLPDQEAFALIFAPGFSTKKEISDVSGRGVGMDVVKTKITQLNGTVEIDSEIDVGTRLDIKVPLTLAIMPTLMIMLEDQTFALPLVNVDEIFHLDLTTTNVVDGQECITIREKAIPIFHLKHWLIEGAAFKEPSDVGHIVIVSVGTQKVGFVVDQLIGQEEVVIKPLGKMLQGTPGMAGATITGDGTIALILDVPSMLKCYAGNAA